MDLPLIFGLGSILVAGIADVVLSMRWSRFYFTFGIPVFVRRVPRPGGLAELDLAELEQPPRITFHRLGPDLIAFREEFGRRGFRIRPIMHGTLRYDAVEGVVRVVGVLNWLAIACIVTLTVLLRDYVQYLAFLLAVFGMLYFVQAIRYDRIARKLSGAAPIPASRL